MNERVNERVSERKKHYPYHEVRALIEKADYALTEHEIRVLAIFLNDLSFARLLEFANLVLNLQKGKQE